jgi:hypothetical protein
MKISLLGSFGGLLVAVAAASCSSSSGSSEGPGVGDAGNDVATTPEMEAGGGNETGTPGSEASTGAETSTTGDGATVATNACDAIVLEQPTMGYQFQIPLTLGAGQEREVCQLVKIPANLDLNWSEGIMTDGSHHALVEATAYNGSIPTTTLDGQTLDGTQVHTCSTPTALWNVKNVIAGGKHVTGADNGTNLPKGTFPSNVAVKLKAGDYVLLNFHLLNPSNQTLNACYKVNLNGVPDSQVTTEAGTIFWYNPFITVPANGTSTARMTCPITSNITMPAAVSHAHSRLTNYEADLMSGDPTSGGTMVQKLYSGTDWDLPPYNVFTSPLSISAGKWIDYHCDYTNSENRNVAQGLQTTDEMCMFIAPYWPRDPNIDNCVSANGNVDFGGHSLGYGTKTGADFLGCYWSTPQFNKLAGGLSTSAARYAAYGCVTQTCSKASASITPYLDCLSKNAGSCQSQCTTLQASFQAICASTPATTTAGTDGGTVEAADGCKAEYGTNGTDGTCAATGQTQAIGQCTTAAQTAELTAQCKQTFCSAYCNSDAGTPDGGVTCSQCVGSFTGSTSDPSCLNQLTLACVAANTKTNAQTCVTNCFTGCITTRATKCTVDCLNNTACGSQYAAVASATCN